MTIFKIAFEISDHSRTFTIVRHERAGTFSTILPSAGLRRAREMCREKYEARHSCRAH